MTIEMSPATPHLVKGLPLAGTCPCVAQTLLDLGSRLTVGRRPYWLVALVAIASHATALGAGFVWLDHSHIESGLALAHPGDIGSLFGHGFAGTGFYRPLMSISLSIDAALGGSPLLFHAVTLAWHAAASVMVVVTAEALGLALEAALCAGLLFAAHPAGSLVANAIAFRSESMMTVGLLALIVGHLRRKPAWAGAALLLAALTKETALLLGPLFIVLLGGRRSPSSTTSADRPAASNLGAVLGAEATALACAVGLRLLFAPAWRASFPDLSIGDAIGTRLAVLTRALVLLLAIPSDLSVCDSFPVTPALAVRSLAGAAVAAAVGLLIWRQRHSVVRIPAVLMALSVVPALHVAPIARWWSPHYLYVPFAFACMVFAERAVRLGWATITMAAVGLLAALSLGDGRRFHSDETLWASELTRHPECREAEFYAGEEDRRRADWNGAALHYQRALTVTPGILSYVDSGAAFQNLGVAQLALGRFDEAQTTFGRARAIVADVHVQRELTHNMATAALRAGRPQEAADLFATETARADAFPESILLHARALHSLGRDADAAALMRQLGANITGPVRPR